MTGRQVFDMLKTPVTLVVLLCILGLGAWYGYSMIMKAPPAPSPSPCTPIAAQKIKATQVTVNVFNAGTARGRATVVAANLKAKGFVTGQVDNTNDRTAQTIVRGAKADSPEVKLVAGFFKNVKIEADNRVDHSVDVLVVNPEPGTDGDTWSGMNENAPTELDVPGGTVCLPATNTPSASASASRTS